MMAGMYPRIRSASTQDGRIGHVFLKHAVHPLVDPG